MYLLPISFGGQRQTLVLLSKFSKLRPTNVIDGAKAQYLNLVEKLLLNSL